MKRQSEMSVIARLIRANEQHLAELEQKFDRENARLSPSFLRLLVLHDQIRTFQAANKSLRICR